ncbi:hypothetical protein D3C81_889170 [compost metagenome]
MRFDGEAIADTASQGGAGDGVGVIAERVDAIVATQPAKACGPVRQARCEQLLGSVEGEVQGLHAAKSIGDHHLGCAGAIDAGLCGKLERTDRDLPGVLAKPVDVELDAGRYDCLAEEGRRGGEHTVGLQAVVAADLHAGHAGRAAPLQEPAVEVAHRQGQCLLRQVQAPAGIQPHRFLLPAFAGELVAAHQRRVAQGAVAEAEQADVAVEADIAQPITVAGVDVVVDSHAG